MKKGKLLAAFALTTALTGGALTAGPVEDMKAKNNKLVSSLTNKKKTPEQQNQTTRPLTMADLKRAYNLTNIQKADYTCPNGQQAEQGFKANYSIKEHKQIRTGVMWGGKCGKSWHARNS